MRPKNRFLLLRLNNIVVAGTTCTEKEVLENKFLFFYPFTEEVHFSAAAHSPNTIEVETLDTWSSLIVSDKYE